jgi:hypothetical protein
MRALLAAGLTVGLAACSGGSGDGSGDVSLEGTYRIESWECTDACEQSQSEIFSSLTFDGSQLRVFSTASPVGRFTYDAVQVDDCIDAEQDGQVFLLCLTGTSDGVKMIEGRMLVPIERNARGPRRGIDTPIQVVEYQVRASAES